MRRSPIWWILPLLLGGAPLCYGAPSRGAAFFADRAPPGGSVRALGRDPFHAGVILLGTATGAVYRSVDNGREWSFFSQIGRHDDWVVASLKADPARPGRWYAGLWSWRQAQQGGAYVSDDGGQTWHALGLRRAVRALALAPSDARELVAGTMDGVYRSQDAGRTWALISPPHDRELSLIDSVAIDPRNPQAIYVGTWHLPWKTFNGGHDWWQMRQGVIDDSDVFSIAVDQADPATVYLSACSGIYRSDDQGMHFEKIEGIPYSARRTPALVPDPAHPGTLYAGTTQGLWLTTDRGAHWQRITSPQLRVEAVLISAGRVLLGTDFAGVYRSGPGERHFTPANRGFASRHVAATAASPAGRYYAVTGDEAWGGVFLHARDGRWEQLPLPPAEAHSLHWSPAGLIAGSQRGVYRWRARPRRWAAVEGGPPGPVYGLASPQPEGREVYAVTAQGLYWSGDGGRRWVRRREAPAPLYRVLAQPGGWVWIAGRGYVLSSGDRGQHFLPGRLSLDGPGAPPADINQLAVAALPGGGRLLLAATTRGLYRSQDGGGHWTLCGHGLPAMAVIGVHVEADGVYALGARVGEVYRSRDAGASWRAVRLPAPLEALARSVPGLGMNWYEPGGAMRGALRRPQSAGRRHVHPCTLLGRPPCVLASLAPRPFQSVVPRQRAHWDVRPLRNYDHPGARARRGPRFAALSLRSRPGRVGATRDLPRIAPVRKVLDPSSAE